MQWKSAAKQSQTCIPQRSEVSGEITAYICLQLAPGNTDHAYSLVIFWSTDLSSSNPEPGFPQEIRESQHLY